MRGWVGIEGERGESKRKMYQTYRNKIQGLLTNGFESLGSF